VPAEEVESRSLPARRPVWGWRQGRDGGLGERAAHVGARSDARVQPSLGAQLLERLDDEATGDAEVRGQRAAWGQSLTGSQAALANRAAEARLDLAAQRRCSRPRRKDSRGRPGQGDG
jgi:hypothetical protein